jgi:hypothetical protein
MVWRQIEYALEITAKRSGVHSLYRRNKPKSKRDLPATWVGTCQTGGLRDSSWLCNMSSWLAALVWSCPNMPTLSQCVSVSPRLVFPGQGQMCQARTEAVITMISDPRWKCGSRGRFPSAALLVSCWTIVTPINPRARPSQESCSESNSNSIPY